MKRWHLNTDVNGRDPLLSEVKLHHGQHANMNAPTSIGNQVKAHRLAAVWATTMRAICSSSDLI